MDHIEKVRWGYVLVDGPKEGELWKQLAWRWSSSVPFMGTARQMALPCPRAGMDAGSTS